MSGLFLNRGLAAAGRLGVTFEIGGVCLPQQPTLHPFNVACPDPGRVRSAETSAVESEEGRFSP